jgi:hypothetical protein
MSSRRIIATMLFVGAVASVAACAGADSVSSDQGRIPALFIRPESLAVHAPAGTSKDLAVAIDRDAYNGPVTLRRDTLPPGITIAFPLNEVSVETTRRLVPVVIHVGQSVPSGRHRIVLRATAPLVPTARGGIDVIVP